jgi:hypothetical protein
MKDFPDLNLSFNPIYKMITASIKSKLILTAIELKVFNTLTNPTTANSVSETLGTHSRSTELFLDALVTIDLLVKKDGKYWNSEITQVFLVEGKETYIGGFLEFQMSFHKPVLDNFAGIIKNGPPPPQENMNFDSEDFWTPVLKNVANFQRTGWGQQIAEIAESLPEFSSFKKMLDLGGSAGLNEIAILLKHPTMKGVLFDRPAIVKVAETFIKEYELEERIEIIGGDYTQDPIGDNYDLIVATGTLNFVLKDLGSMLKKLFDALNPGGVFISIHDGLTEEMTKPEMALDWLSSNLLGQDWSIEKGLIADLLIKTGFKSVLSRTIESPLGILDVDIGRK